MRHAVLALLLTGCSYDWAASAAASDAGRDGLPADVSVADAFDGAPSDAVAEPPVDASPNDSSVGSDADGSAPDCQQLQQDAENALGPALVCTPGMNACQAQTHDWCGCTVYLAASNGAYANFVNAVSAFEMAGCRSSATVFCADTCPSATPGLCVVSDAAAMYACFR